MESEIDWAYLYQRVSNKSEICRVAACGARESRGSAASAVAVSDAPMLKTRYHLFVGLSTERGSVPL